MSNIIEFPNKTPQTFPASIEESLGHVEEVRRDYCEEVSADVLEAVFIVLTNYGIKVDTSDPGIKNMVFLEEAIKALVYSTKNLYHPFHKLSQDAIVLETEKDADFPMPKESNDNSEEKHLTT